MDGSREYQRKRVKFPPTAQQAKRYRIAYWVTSIISVLTALNALWSSRVGLYLGSDAIGASLHMIEVSGVAAITTFIMGLIRIRDYQESWARRAILSVSILVPIAVPVLACILMAKEVPFRFAFACSRGAMERAIANARADPLKGKCVQRAGLMPLKSITIQGGGAMVSTQGAEMLDSEPYLQWTPGGGPPVGSFISVEPLGNDWYWINR